MVGATALARRQATPQAIDILRLVSLRRSRELLLLEGPVQSNSEALIEPLSGYRTISRGFVTGKDRFTCCIRITTSDPAFDEVIKTLTERYGFTALFFGKSHILGSDKCPSFYIFYKTKVEASRLFDALVSLHDLAVAAYMLKEQSIGRLLPKFMDLKNTNFAEQAVHAMNAL